MHDNILTYCHFCLWSGVKDARGTDSAVHWNTHFQVKQFKCSFCDEKFYDQKVKRRHEKSIHEIIKNRYKCTLCDYETHASSSYYEHLRYKH